MHSLQGLLTGCYHTTESRRCHLKCSVTAEIAGWLSSSLLQIVSPFLCKAHCSPDNALLCTYSTTERLHFRLHIVTSRLSLGNTSLLWVVITCSTRTGTANCSFESSSWLLQSGKIHWRVGSGSGKENRKIAPPGNADLLLGAVGGGAAVDVPGVGVRRQWRRRLVRGNAPC